MARSPLFFWQGQGVAGVFEPGSPQSTFQKSRSNPAKAEGRPVTLTEVMRRRLRLGHYSLRTEEAYVGWVKRFMAWARNHPHLTHLTPAPLPRRTAERVAADSPLPPRERRGRSRGGIPGFWA